MGPPVSGNILLFIVANADAKVKCSAKNRK
jgi:hypothetical protein